MSQPDTTTTQKRLAIGFFGMSYNPAYRHWDARQPLIAIDYRKSLANYADKLFAPFERNGYQIDVFFATNKHDLIVDIARDHGDRFRAYTVFSGQSKNVHHSRNIHVQNVVQLIHSQQQSTNHVYDQVLLTRFDLEFKLTPADLAIDVDKFNISMRCERDPLIDDNLYMFPGRYVTPFLKIMFAQVRTNAHCIRPVLESAFKAVNFMVPGNYLVGDSPIYKIHRCVASAPVQQKNRIAIALYGQAPINRKTIDGLAITDGYDVFYSGPHPIDSMGLNNIIHSHTCTSGEMQQLTSVATQVEAAQQFNGYIYTAIIFCRTDIEPLQTLQQWDVKPNTFKVPFAVSVTDFDTSMMVLSGTMLRHLMAVVLADASKPLPQLIACRPEAAALKQFIKGINSGPVPETHAIYRRISTVVDNPSADSANN